MQWHIPFEPLQLHLGRRVKLPILERVETNLKCKEISLYIYIYRGPGPV